MSPLVERYDSSTIRVETPDGTMFVIFDEDSDTLALTSVRIIIGKAGSNLVAWAETVSRLVTLCINNGVMLDDILKEVSQQTTAKVAMQKGTIPIRSGPEGLAYAIMQYRWDRAKRLEQRSIIAIDRRRRPARFENVER